MSDYPIVKAYGLRERGEKRLKIRDYYRDVEVLAKHYGVTVTAILSRSRTSQVATARRAVVRMLDAIGCSSVEIGRLINRDHTTVLHYLGRIGARSRT